MSQLRECGLPTRSGPCQGMVVPGQPCPRNHLPAGQPRSEATATTAAADPEISLDGPPSFTDTDFNRLLDADTADDDGWGGSPDDGWGPPAEPAPTPSPASNIAPSLADWTSASPAPDQDDGSVFHHESDAKQAADEEYAGSADIVVVEQTGDGMFSYRSSSEPGSGRSWIKRVRDATGRWHTFKSPEIATEFVIVEGHLRATRAKFYKLSLIHISEPTRPY